MTSDDTENALPQEPESRKKPYARGTTRSGARKRDRGNFPGGIEPTQSLLAQAFGVTQTTISTWVGEGAPIRQDGTYSVVEVERWRTKRGRGDGAAEIAADDWELRKLAAEAQRKELDLARARQELFSRDDVEKLFAGRLAALVRGLEGLPRIMALETHGMDRPEIEARARAVVDELRDAYARDDVLTILEEWRRQAEAGVKIGRGRGRPRKS